MAKKSSVEKNNKRIRMVELYKERRAVLKKATVDLSLSLEDRMAAQAKLSDLPKNSSAVRIRNRCSQTGRARGFLRFLVCLVLFFVSLLQLVYYQVSEKLVGRE